MARYDHLPIYKSVYELNLYFYRLSRGFAKDIKYGLAQEIRDLLENLADQIVISNNSKDKAIILEEAELLVERIKFKNRMLKDVNAESLKSYEYFSRQ